jgi:hypothetical protein
MGTITIRDKMIKSTSEEALDPKKLGGNIINSFIRIPYFFRLKLIYLLIK